MTRTSAAAATDLDLTGACSEQRQNGVQRMAESKTKMYSFRLPVDLVERLDTFAAEWQARLPGLRITRTEVVRNLLESGLERGVMFRTDDQTKKKAVKPRRPR